MTIRRIKVLLAKGWYVAVWCVSYSLFSLFCSFASAKGQNVTAAAVQDSIKAGDIISGTVTDSEGPMMMVNITERDSKNRIVAHSVTDLEGNFSFRLVDPKDRLEITMVGYEKVDTVINSTHFDIRMKDNKGIPPVMVEADRPYVTMYGPPIRKDEFEGLGVVTVEDNPKAYGTLVGLDIVFNSGDLNVINRPMLILDGETVKPDTVDWAGFDLTKTDYSKNQVARLFGVKARKIKSVTVLKGEAARTVWGTDGRNGVIVVKTKKGYRKMKKGS